MPVTDAGYVLRRFSNMELDVFTSPFFATLEDDAESASPASLRRAATIQARSISGLAANY